jgi:hypothetical protein
MFAEFQVGQVLWSMVWFAIFFLWIALVIRVFGDIFRSRDLSGGTKLIWTLAILFLPYVGVFVYVLIRGGSMADREVRALEAQDDAARAYIREAAGSGGAAELAQLEDLRAKGPINDSEFETMKARVVGA